MIAYYSWEGHTKKVAESLASKINAPTERIEPVNESNMVMKVIMAILGLKSDIKPCKSDLTEIDHLVVATSVWTGLPLYTSINTSLY